MTFAAGNYSLAHFAFTSRAMRGLCLPGPGAAGWWWDGGNRPRSIREKGAITFNRFPLSMQRKSGTVVFAPL